MSRYEQNKMSKIPLPLFRNFESLGRRWVGKTMPNYLAKGYDKNFEFKVASYNVLADNLLKEHPHLYWYNQNSQNSWIYDWKYRKQNLLKEIKFADADVLCLQEVQEEHYYNWYFPRLSEEGYDGVYKKRSGDKRDGCATFFKRSRFSIIACHLLDFNHTNIPMMDRNNVAVLLLLSPNCKEKKPTICVSNTHLLFNKKRGDIKLAQLAYIFAEIDRLSTFTADAQMPVVMCGDFNSIPFSPFYEFVTRGELNYRGMNTTDISGQGSAPLKHHRMHDVIFPPDLRLTNACTWRDGRNLNGNVAQCSNNNGEDANRMGILSHDLKLQSSYLHIRWDSSREVTTCHDRACMTVDYIFYTPCSCWPTHHGGMNEERLWLSGVLSLLTEPQLKSMGQLPNSFLSSDHLMLLASFVLK